MTNPTAAWRPEEGSLAERLCAYLARHQGTEFTSREVAVRLDVPSQGVHAGLRHAVDHGWLKAALAAGRTLAEFDVEAQGAEA